MTTRTTRARGLFPVYGHIGCAVLWLVAGAGCGGEIASKTQNQWYCTMKGDLARCRAAIPKRDDEAGAYACKVGNTADACPAPAAIEQIRGAVPKGMREQFGKMTWACLLTGEDARECTRSLHYARKSFLNPGGQKLSSGSSSSGSSGASQSGGSATSTGSKPRGRVGISGVPLPTNCAPHSWEIYFAAHATASYKRHGINITFPSSGLFNARGSLLSSLVGTANLPTTPGAPSCAPGEWDMRTGAWLDAVSRGCLLLSHAILVMCQQAVNYAPKTKKCNLTGTW